MEGTNQAVAPAPQTASAMPTASVPNVAYQPVMSQSPTYQASPTAQAVLQQPPAVTYQPVAAQPVSAANLGAAPAAANPWQEAFQALSASLNTNNQSQAPAQFSAYQTPTPQTNTQVNWGSTANSVTPQQWLNRTSTPYVTPTPAAPTPSNQQQQVKVSDGYLSGVTDQSLEVLEHFGAEAPALLNQYACAVEDALIEQVHVTQNQNAMLEAASKERQAMNTMLTNPDVLADYVNEFFGPEGPYPTETPEEQYEREQYEAREQFEYEIEQQEMGRVPQQFQRPEMDMPTPGRAVNEANDFWGGFSEMMDNNPENAWRFLAQAPQGALQQKALVQDT